MGNRNYSRGYATEYKIVQHFRDKGIWAIRSPASKGMFDVIAIDKNGVYLIQAKRSKRKPVKSMYKDEIQGIQQWLRSLPHSLPRWLHVQFWVWVDRKGWTKLEIKPKTIKVIEGDAPW